MLASNRFVAVQQIESERGDREEATGPAYRDAQNGDILGSALFLAQSGNVAQDGCLLSQVDWRVG